MSADSRRAARTAERVFNALAALAVLAWIVGLLRSNAEWLGWIAMGLLIKDGLRELMIGGENVAARLDLSLSRDGARGSFNNRPDDPGGDAAAGAALASAAEQGVANEFAEGEVR